jgi:hypothetical protein
MIVVPGVIAYGKIRDCSGKIKQKPKPDRSTGLAVCGPIV